MRPSMLRMGPYCQGYVLACDPKHKENSPVSVSRRECREGELGVAPQDLETIGKEIDEPWWCTLNFVTTKRKFDCRDGSFQRSLRD